ncbi:MAG: ATP-binding cassette domain-containing protein [Lachnospiraceae bacterium]|nr:ATP-binding cassette domain-containing protein [Lachnospiraceae bacterium]
MIEVKDLVKKYGSHLAVDGLNFKVEKGQIYGFLGPNGAGKSTTMNMITGYLASTSGTITIDGHDILKEPEEAKKRIGYLPELPPLYPDMTVSEYLKFVSELKKIKKTERQKMIDEVMEMTRITEVKDRLIRNLSKGYKQRVGLAQAILGYPEVIILDEPTVGLDPKQIIEIRDLIKSLSKKHTVILSSHILSEVSAICDHILIISKGKLVASDTPDHLSKLMSGTNSLALTVKTDLEKAHQLFKDFKKIKSIEIHDSTIRGAQDMILQMEGTEDIREAIFYQCAEKKCPILQMKQNNMSLEDVFLELTSDDEPKQSQTKEIEEENDKKEEAESHDSSL